MVEKTIWGVHMERQHGSRPITDGFVAIGWEAVGDLSFLSPNREAFKKAVITAYPETKPGAIPVLAGTLFKFATEMNKGDLVIYPSKLDRHVNLGVIDSGYIYNPSTDEEFPNRRKVKWLRGIVPYFSKHSL